VARSHTAELSPFSALGPTHRDSTSIFARFRDFQVCFLLILLARPCASSLPLRVAPSAVSLGRPGRPLFCTPSLSILLLDLFFFRLWSSVKILCGRASGAYDPLLVRFSTEVPFRYYEPHFWRLLDSLPPIKRPDFQNGLNEYPSLRRCPPRFPHDPTLPVTRFHACLRHVVPGPLDPA